LLVRESIFQPVDLYCVLFSIKGECVLPTIAVFCLSHLYIHSEEALRGPLSSPSFRCGRRVSPHTDSACLVLGFLLSSVDEKKPVTAYH
jgi:hypothetical protein